MRAQIENRRDKKYEKVFCVDNGRGIDVWLTDWLWIEAGRNYR